MTTRALTLLLLAAFTAACGRDGAHTAPAATPPTAGSGPASAASLLPAGGTRSLCGTDAKAFLGARLRGAIEADIDWRADAMECEGGLRPDGRGVRAAFAGDLPARQGDAPHRLRFIFGIDLEDTATGSAQVLPVNLTVILEGEKQLYSTRGDDRCAAEITDRGPLPGATGKGLERISVRGYCLAPAEDAAGERRLLVPTFEFAGIIRTGEDP
jgi:hypothetical protein